MYFTSYFHNVCKRNLDTSQIYSNDFIFSFFLQPFLYVLAHSHNVCSLKNNPKKKEKHLHTQTFFPLNFICKTCWTQHYLTHSFESFLVENHIHDGSLRTIKPFFFLFLRIIKLPHPDFIARIYKKALSFAE